MGHQNTTINVFLDYSYKGFKHLSIHKKMLKSVFICLLAFLNRLLPEIKDFFQNDITQNKKKDRKMCIRN